MFLLSVNARANAACIHSFINSFQRMPKGELIEVDSPFKMPDADKRIGTQEPFVRLEMLTPQV